MNSGTMTKIVDSCRYPVTMAGEACRASPSARVRGGLYAKARRHRAACHHPVSVRSTWRMCSRSTSPRVLTLACDPEPGRFGCSLSSARRRVGPGNRIMARSMTFCSSRIIARAGIVGEGRHRLGGDGVDALAQALRTVAHEVAHQQGIIRRLLTQGGHDNGEHVQPIIQILS
jgi:hypothetical protein